MDASTSSIPPIRLVRLFHVATFGVHFPISHLLYSKYQNSLQFSVDFVLAVHKAKAELS